MNPTVPCTNVGTICSNLRIKSTDYHSLQDVPVIEFIPPSRINVEEICDHDVPRSHRFSCGPRLLKLELLLPGILQPNQKGGPVLPVHRQHIWSQHWLNCGSRADRNPNRIKHKRVHCLNKQKKRSQKIGYSSRSICLSTRTERWIRGNCLQQPQNGDLWYRANESRVQVSVFLNDEQFQFSEQNSSEESHSSSSISARKTPPLHFGEKTINRSYTNICPHYFYWDSGHLAHPISVNQSQLVTENDHVLLYLTIEGARRNDTVWSREEINALSHSITYEKLKKKVSCMDFQASRLPETDQNTQNHECVQPECMQPCEKHNEVTYEVVLDRKPGQSLGLTLVEKPLPLGLYSNGGNCSGIFIKYLAPGGLAEQSGRVRVNDQLLTVNSVSVLACDSSNLHTDGRVQLDLWQSCPGQSDCQSSLRSGHVSANWATLVAHNTDMKSRSNTIDTGTLMYPFAVRLLRQVIGPIRLGMRRIANVHSSSHVNNTEQTLVDLEPETSELLAITSIGDDTGMSQSGIRNMSKNGECGSSNFGDLSLVPGQNQMPEKAPSPEQSLTSTRPTLSPLEIPHDPKPPASVLIDEEDSPTTQGQVVEMVVQEPITVTKLPLRYSPRMARKAQMTHVTDTERLLSLSSINTPQSIEGPEQIKIQLSNPKPSPPQIPTRGTGNLQRRCRTVRLEHNRFSKQKYTAVVIPPVLQAESIPIPPKPRSRHLFTAQLTKPEATITSVPQPPPRLSSASLSIPVGKPSFGKRYSTCKRVESLPRVKRHHTSTPKAHTEWPPSSGDHSHSHRVHHGHMVSVRTSPPRRQCKMSEQSNRHHIAHTDHRCVNKSSVTASNKSSGRLDSRLAALAKHIPQSTDCPTSHGPQPTTIDADDSQQFQELIANLTETEWQALLHMISQPDESYQSPKMRNRQEKLPGLAMRQRMKFNHWSREGVQPNKQMERGDGHRKDLRHGVHANRQKTSRVTENRTPACHNEIR